MSSCCHHEGGHGEPAAGEAPLKDPVCGMTVTTESPHHLVHEGTDYFFCNPRCREKFAADPERYLSDAPVEEPAAPPGTVPTVPVRSLPIALSSVSPIIPSARTNLSKAPESRDAWIIPLPP